MSPHCHSVCAKISPIPGIVARKMQRQEAGSLLPENYRNLMATQ